MSLLNRNATLDWCFVNRHHHCHFVHYAAILYILYVVLAPALYCELGFIVFQHTSAKLPHASLNIQLSIFFEPNDFVMHVILTGRHSPTLLCILRVKSHTWLAGIMLLRIDNCSRQSFSPIHQFLSFLSESECTFLFFFSFFLCSKNMVWWFGNFFQLISMRLNIPIW